MNFLLIIPFFLLNLSKSETLIASEEYTNCGCTDISSYDPDVDSSPPDFDFCE